MATESTALSSDPAAAGKTEPPSPNERAHRNDRRIPTARETLATLPEFADDEFDFEPHDTIPAPPWLEELEDKLAPPPADRAP
jgi:hypothetical protein